MDWIGIIFPIAIKVIGILIPIVGGAIGGPLGWFVSLILTKLTEALVLAAEQLAISAAIKNQVNELNAAAQEFFEIEDKRERGEALAPGEREDAKKKLKDAARKLIRITKR